MKINIQTKNLTLTPVIKVFIEEKIGSLEKFSNILYRNDYKGLVSGKPKAPFEAWVEVGKTTRHHRKGDIFRAECQMKFPGHDIRAEAVSDDLMSAIVEIKDELQREIKKEKGKVISKRRKI